MLENEEKMQSKKKKIGLLFLMTYILFLLFLAVLSRDSGTSNTIKSELFWGFNNPPEHIFRDNLLNIISFIPIGFLTGIISPKLRMLNALLVGLLVSLVIECSQLTLKRGVFDVDDLFNNSVGALIGGAIVWFTTIGSRLRVHG